MRCLLIFSLSFTLIFLLLNTIIPFCVAKQAAEYSDIEDNDFAEFDFQDDAEEGVVKDDEDATVEDEKDEGEGTVIMEDEEVEDGSEFSHFDDEEEFIGFRNKEEDDPEEFQNERPASSRRKAAGGQGGKPPQKLTYPEIHVMRSNWENYYMEILMIVGIVIYFLNFFTGKTKNQKLANLWFSSHRTFLESQFSLVGDDGAKNIEEIQEPLNKESENIFTLWCSGRTCCEGMLVELKLLKRQDLLGVISYALKPQYDQVHIRVDMNPEDIDNVIFCISSKKSSQRLSKDMYDLNVYCPERRPADKYDVPGSYFIMSEVAEVASAMLDSKLVSVFKKYPDVIDTIHFSDQFSGPKPPDDQQLMQLPKGKPVLNFVFNLILGSGSNNHQEAIEETKPFLHLVFYCLDKVKRYKLTREAKAKVDKNRSRVAENHWRSIHAAKAEKAAEEREKRRREVKEKIKEIEDPEKQRKMEERENRKEKKKMQPKVKQLKVKSM